MNYWLMKSEPDAFSIDMLKKMKVSPWDGVRNYQVRNMIRDDMKVGDIALFYHSNAGLETGIAGQMKISSTAYPDPTQFDSKSQYYDAKSTRDNPRWLCVDVAFLSKLPRVVTLQEIKSNKFFAQIPLVQRGTRLSIMPLSEKHFKKIIALAERK